MALSPARMRSLSQFDQIVCGVDEAGRGPWAGPVVVAAVVLPRTLRIEGLADSKVLSHKVRCELFEHIVAEAAVSTVVVAARRVDEMNIRAATLWGMRRAVATLPVRPSVALIDGRDVPDGLCVKGRALVGGDGRSTAIAAASIVAKVTRDRLMTQLARAFPHYGFERHKGYGTPEHRAALALHGPCVHHRRSFAPIRACLGSAGDVRTAPCDSAQAEAAFAETGLGYADAAFEEATLGEIEPVAAVREPRARRVPPQRPAKRLAPATAARRAG